MAEQVSTHHRAATQAGWSVNKKRVARIWRSEGIKIPLRQPKRSRLWFNEGSCIRLRPERAIHVWAYDLVENRTHDGRKIRMVNIVDEFTREALAIRLSRRLNPGDVIDVLPDLLFCAACPHISGQITGPSSSPSREGLDAAVGAQTAYITTGSPWENGYTESFNARPAR
jgi:putative transposase